MRIENDEISLVVASDAEAAESDEQDFFEGKRLGELFGLLKWADHVRDGTEADIEEGSQEWVASIKEFRVMPARACWSLSVGLGTMLISCALIGLVSFRVAHYEQNRQYRCFAQGRIGGLCRGAFDNETCILGICSADPCGTKVMTGIDISVAGANNGTSTPVDGIAVLMIGWSLVPYLLFLLLVGVALLFRSTTTLSPLGLLITITALNEGILKSILREPRPPGSCLYGQSFGMPSGHAASSIGMLCYLLLETLCDRPKLTARHKAAASALLLAALAPVPASRVYLHDHTPAQAAAGSVVGAAVGAAWFAFLFYAALPSAAAAALGAAFRAAGIRHTYRRRSSPLLLVLGVYPRAAPPPEIKQPASSA